MPSLVDQERASLMGAFRRTVAERGYRNLTVEAVVSAAGLPRDRFYAHFENQEQALLAAQAEFLEGMRRRVKGSSEASSDWPDQIRAGLNCVLEAVSEAEGLARALAVEAPGASFAAAQRQFEALEEFAAMLRDGRRRYARASKLPPIAERVIVGGIASIVTQALLAEEAAALQSLEPQLVEQLLRPYLGADQALAIAGR